MSPTAQPILSQFADMSEFIRDTAAFYPSAFSSLSHPPAAEKTGGDFSSYPKFERYSRPTRPAEKAIVLVRGLKRYGAGWNGFGAEAPREAAIRDSLDFLSRTCSEAPFRVDLDEDGSINLAVEFPSVRLLLTFEGDGRIAVSERTQAGWLDLGTFPIRGALGRASPDVERLLAQN